VCSASRSVTMTRPSHRGQGRKSRLLAKLASTGGNPLTQGAAFRPSVTGSGDIGICPGDGPAPPVRGRSRRSRLKVAARRADVGRESGRGWSCLDPIHDPTGGPWAGSSEVAPEGACSSGCSRSQVWRWSPVSRSSRRRIRRRLRADPTGVAGAHAGGCQRNRCRTRARAGRAWSCACSITGRGNCGFADRSRKAGACDGDDKSR
jgi:hypothetical protein